MDGKLIRFGKRINRHKFTLVMLLPAFVLTFIFAYVPVSGWVMAFTDYRIGGGLFSGEFAGLRFFKRFLFDSSDFSYLLRNTLVMNVSAVVVNLIIAVVFSIMLHEIRLKGLSKTLQTATFFPYFISWVISYSVVWALFAVRSGAINQFLVEANLVPSGINLLGDPKYSWGLMIFLSMWKHTGYNSVIFLATISGIPHEEYEAAAIDGAGRFRLMYHVTLMNMLPTVAILLIMNSGWVLSSSLEQFFVFSNSTNWETMEVLDMYIYKFGLKNLNYSYATAVGILKTVVSIFLVWAANFGSKKLNGSSIF
ncbi:MAG: ABC transporter permease subunit [Treponema sp.]|jgi:putative aldouronate transport system permease protein|nr:ABC transporter permease subunit [Treponema sp.]